MGKRLSQLGQAEQVKKEDYLLVDGQNYLESKKIPFKDINLSNFNTNGFYDQNTVDSLLEQKQNSLVSGKTIKTINGLNLLGEGNITIATDADQTYSPTSENAQSGKAVAEAFRFKKLLSTEVTQEAFNEANGEIKVISLGNENKTFDGVNQIRVLIYLPISDTINTANSRLAIRATANAGDSLAPDNTILLKGNGAGESITLLYNKSQHLSATLDFIDNKFVQGICVKNLYGSYTYGTSAYGWTHSDINMGDKKYLHIRSFDSKFKFPIGTKIEVYGR